MGLWDWLLPYHGHDDQAPTGGPRRRTSVPFEVVGYGARHGDTITICTACDRRADRCACIDQGRR